MLVAALLGTLIGLVPLGAAYAEETPAPEAPATTAAPPTTQPLAPQAAAYLAKIEPLVTEAQTALTTATTTRDTLVAERATIVTRNTVADARMVELQTLAATLVAKAQETKRRLSIMAAHAYRDADSERPATGNDLGDALAADRSAMLADSVGNAKTRLIAQYQREKQAADDAQADVKKEKDYLAKRSKELEVEVPAAEAALLAATAYHDRVGRLLDAWRSVELGPNTPILGQPRLSGEELAAWFTGTNRKANTTVPIEELAAIYVDEGKAEGVRSDIAFAQSILETGSFSYPDYGQVRGTDNNFAGIGACDSCDNGYGFPDARTGVRAQIQHLRNYAQPGVTESQLAHPAVLPKFDQFSLKGKAPTWQALTGTWASSTTYGPKIFGVYFGILEWVTTHMLLPDVAAAKPKN